MSKTVVLLALILANSSILNAQEDIAKIKQDVHSYQQEVSTMSHFNLAEALNLNAASMIYRCGKDFFFGLYNGIKSQTLSPSIYSEYLRQARSRNSVCLMSTLRFKIVTDEIRTRNTQAASQITSDASQATSQLAEETSQAATEMAYQASQATADLASQAAQATQEKAQEGWELLKIWGQKLIEQPQEEAGNFSRN